MFAKRKVAMAASKTWIVRRIGETREFGVFCTSPDESVMLGTKEACEARRDELTAKYAESAAAAAA